MSFLRRIVRVLILVLLIGTLSAAAQDTTPESASVTWELTEPSLLANGLATLSYPKGWYVSVPARNQKVISNGEARVGSGVISASDVEVRVVVDTLSNLRRSERLTTAITETPLQFLEVAIEQEQLGIVPASTVDDPIELTFNGYAAASAVDTIPGFRQVQIIVVEIAEEIIAVVHITTEDGELERWQPVALAIVESITFNGTAKAEQIIAVPDIPLLELAFIGDTEITVNFPEGWVSRRVGRDALMMANKSEALSIQLGDAFEPGSTQIFVRAGTTETFTGFSNGTILDVIQPHIEVFSPNPAFQIGTIDSFQIENTDVISVSITGVVSDVKIWVIELTPEYVVVIRTLSAPGELDQWTLTALAIAESITYNGEVETPPEATEALALPLTKSYITENSMFGIDYPAGWTFETYFPPSQDDWILSANIRNKQALTAEQIFPAGAVSIDVTVTDIENFVVGVQRDPSVITAEDILRFRWFGLSADQANMVNDLMQIPAANGGYERGSIEPVMVGEHEAARMDMQLPGFNEGFALAYVDNDIVVEIRLITAPGELHQWRATALAIAEGFGYFG